MKLLTKAGQPEPSLAGTTCPPPPAPHHHGLFSVGCLHPCYSQTSVFPSEVLQKKQCCCHMIVVLFITDLGKFCPACGTCILENASKATSYKTIVISLGAVVSLHAADPRQLLWDVSWCRFVCIGTAQAALAPQPSCLFLRSSFLPNPFLG